MSVIADRGKYPPPSIMIVGPYQAAILPRGNKPTRIPEHLRSILKANFVYSIRIRITQPEVMPKIIKLPIAQQKAIKTNEDSSDVQIVSEHIARQSNAPSGSKTGHLKPTEEAQHAGNGGLRFGMSALSAWNVKAPGMKRLQEGGLGVNAIAVRNMYILIFKYILM